MKVLRIAFVLALVSAWPNEAKIDPPRSANHDSPMSTQQPAPACDIVFFKDKYVIAEGERLVMALEADCPRNSPTDARFEFLESPPRFVSLSYVYRSEISALKLLSVQPRRGDAGDYRITFNMIACTGGAGCGRFTFRLKVKPAQ